jgi:hypothetical protein
MKKIIAIAVLATMTMASCTKDYTCTCVEEGQDDYVTDLLGYKEADAETACDNLEFTDTEECTISEK